VIIKKLIEVSCVYLKKNYKMSEDTYLVFELDTLSTVPESIFISLSYPFTVDGMKVMTKSFDIDLNV
jgi:hypothetical protein